MSSRDEVKINYGRTDEKIEVRVRYGDAQIKVKSTSEEGGEDLALLVQHLPEILTKALEALEAEDEDEPEGDA